MKEAVVAGVGMTRWGKWDNRTALDLGMEAAEKALCRFRLEMEGHSTFDCRRVKICWY